MNQSLPKAEIAARIASAAEILQIGHLLARRPHQLSGGQSQRVAIGRAIVKEPKAFLFDEPLSNLDAELRVKMRGEIISLHRRLGATMVYVTHDQVEAMTMADRIVVLRDGVDRADRHPDRALRPAAQPLRRRLPRRPADEHAARHRRAATATGRASRWTTAATSPLPGRDLARRRHAGVASASAPSTPSQAPGALEVTVGTIEMLGSETIVHGTTAAGAAPSSSPRRGISRAPRRATASGSTSRSPSSTCSTPRAAPSAPARTGATPT